MGRLSVVRREIAQVAGLPGVNAVPADEAVGTYLTTDGSRSARAADSRIAVAIDDATWPLQEQIDAWSAFGKLRGDWTATAYDPSDIVAHSGSIWGAKSTATSGDVPGVAALWMELPGTVDATARSEIEARAPVDIGLNGDAFGVVLGASIEDGTQTEMMVGLDGNVPDWVLARWAVRKGWGPSDLTPIDIWIIAGQSNSIRRPPATQAPQETPTDWIVTQNYASHVWHQEASAPWLGSGVARAWWERDARAVGRRVGTIEAGIGGTGFTPVQIPTDYFTWDQTDTTSERNLAIETRDWALAALADSPDGSVIKGIIWSQGEADRGYLTTSEYGAKLDSLIGWFRTELGISDLPFICTPFTPLLPVYGDEAETLAIQDALEDLPRRVERTAYLLRSPDDSTADNYIHWAPDAQHRRGKAIIVDPDPLRASAWDQALLNTAAAQAREVPGLTITRSGDVATLTWGHPPTRVVSFTLETSVDSGANWVTETLAASLTHRAVKSVAAGTPLWARMTTVAASGSSYITVEVHG
jgi:hypothetical protein